jgi:hypothetical protein
MYCIYAWYSTLFYAFDYVDEMWSTGKHLIDRVPVWNAALPPTLLTRFRASAEPLVPHHFIRSIEIFAAATMFCSTSFGVSLTMIRK